MITMAWKYKIKTRVLITPYFTDDVHFTQNTVLLFPLSILYDTDEIFTKSQRRVERYNDG